MSTRADEGGRTTAGYRTAVVCDANPVNLRFLRAAMQNLGFSHVAEARDVETLVRKSSVLEPQLVVFDPTMESGAGIEAFAQLEQDLPEAVVIAFSSDEDLCRRLQRDGQHAVERASIRNLERLVAEIEALLGLTSVAPTDRIADVNTATPVWEDVPSLVEG